MVVLQKIDDSMFDDIYQEFLIDDDPDLTREDWQRLFACRNVTGQDCAGYALVDGSTIGGVLGTLFSRRHINGEEKQFCNLHTWMVKPEFRGNSLLLMRPVLRMSDHTVTDFTPTDPVRQISRRLGFQELNSALRVLLPTAGLKDRNRKVEILSDHERICTQLPNNESQLFHDHGGPSLGHLLVSEGSRQCYLIYSRVTRWRLSYCHVHYISDSQIFANNSLQIRRHILQTENVRFLVLNERQGASMELGYSFRFPYTNGQLYRTNTVSPGQIDSLYSDVSLLNLTTVALSQAAWQKLRFIGRLGRV